jgi:hypothetical protein
MAGEAREGSKSREMWEKSITDVRRREEAQSDQGGRILTVERSGIFIPQREITWVGERRRPHEGMGRAQPPANTHLVLYHDVMGQ